MAHRGCKNPTDIFCYVCGFYVGGKQISYKIQRSTKYSLAYHLYFGMPIGDQDKSWAPHIICGNCRSLLENWLRGGQRCMPFGIPRIWREPQNHYDDCYFCKIDVSKYRKVKGRQGLEYPDLPSSMRPVPHSENIPIPKPPQHVSTIIGSFLCNT